MMDRSFMHKRVYNDYKYESTVAKGTARAKEELTKYKDVEEKEEEARK